MNGDCEIDMDLYQRMFEFQMLCRQMLRLIKQKGLYFLFEDVVEEALER